MFNNQLSAKELYSTNPSQFLQRSGFRTEPEDSAFNSSLSQNNSQIMSSQMDNSQSSSFDMFSQMPMSQQGFLQQTENTNNPQRFYMKYMSKAPLFNKEPDKNLPPRRKSFQEQLDSNKQKAKERDDRDLINTFINLVKECSEEVKSAASDIRKDVDKNISESTIQFSSLIQKINEDLKQYHNTLLAAVKVREDQQAVLEAMQRDIAAREAKIDVLEMQLATANKQRDERVVESVLEAYSEQQQMNREQMDKMQEEQQTFCKTQMDRLQQDQKSYLLRCEAEMKATKAGEPQTATGRRDGLGCELAGASLPLSVTETGCRPSSWQGLPHYEQSGRHTQMMRSYQENPGFQNKMLPLQSNTSIVQHNDVRCGTDLQPASTSFSNHGNRISLPSTSVAWSMPLETQNRELYLQSSNQCYQEHNPYNQSVVTQQTRSAVPKLPTASSGGQEFRPLGLNPQQGNQALPVMSPPGTSNQGPWSSNKLKPSPMAAVAPQVKPQKVVYPSQEQNNQDDREETSETSQAAVPKKKKRKKRCQAAVKTTRQSSSAKAKQQSTSERMRNVESDQETHERQEAVPIVNTIKPAQIKKAHIQLKTKENIYEYKEEGKNIPTTKYKPHGKQNERVQQTSRHEAEKDVQRSSKELPKRRGRPPKVFNPAGKRPLQSKASSHLPRAADEDGKQSDTDMITVSSVTKKSRRKKKDKSLLIGVPFEEAMFTQARVGTYAKGQIGRSYNARSSTNLPKIQNQKPNWKRLLKKQKPDVISYGSSSEDEECGNQRSNGNLSQDLSSQDESDNDREEQNMEPIRIQRKTKKQANQKPTGKPVSCPVQPPVSQLDTMPSFSYQEESSEEMIFSLKLPDSPCLQNTSLKQARYPQRTEEQVVPIARSSDMLSTPYIQLNNEQDSDNESVGTTYSVSTGPGRKLSRHVERKRRLIHYSGSSTSAAMVEISNSLRLQHGKIRRISSCH